jgi:hypothetical protein
VVTFDRLRELALALTEAEEGTSYGTPASKVRGKLFACVWTKQEDVLVVRCEGGHREALIAARPDVYFVTPHHEPYGYLLVRLAHVEEEDLDGLLADAWHLAAPKRLAANLTASKLPE